MAILAPIRNRFYNNDGTPAAGGKIYIFEAGSSTPKNSYTDSTGATPNTVPVILDSHGECNLWTSGLFKINLTQSNDVQVTGYPIDNLGLGQNSYDIAGYVSGKPTSSQIILSLPMTRAVTFDVNMLLSKASATIGATASTVFNISRNTTNFATMTFAIGGTIGTFVSATPPVFSIGDVLSVTAPASADVTLANIGFILVGSI